MPTRSTWWRLLALALVVGAPSLAAAEEEPERFLEALRQAKYYDVAAEYLQWAATSSSVSDEFKSSIPYEEAVTKVSQATALSDATQAEKELRNAVAKFQEFLKANPESKLRDKVKFQISNINVVLAGLKLRQLELSGGTDNALREQARKLFEEALAIVTEAEASVLGQLKKMPQHIPPKDKALVEKRDELRGEWINTEMMQCRIHYQLSKTYEPGSKEAKEQLTKAAAEYEKMYEKHYPDRMAGLDSRLWQGKALQELGKHAEATECFEDLLIFEEKDIKKPFLYVLYTEALRRKIESLTAQKKFDEAIQAANTKIGADARRPEWLAVQFFGAKAYLAKAETLEDKETEQRAARDKATKLAEPVANVRGDYQLEARRLLEEMGKTVKLKEPENFAEAKNRADLASQRWQIALKAVGEAPADKKEELEKDLAEKRDNAIRYYRQALRMAGPKTPPNDLNDVYYRLSFLYWDAKDYPAAAVMGEHLARNFPQAAGAKAASVIALKAWLSEYGAIDPNRERDFETARIVSICKYVTEQFKNSDESVEALFILQSFAIQDEDIDAALAYLEQIPETAPRRGEAEVRMGVSLWRVYLSDLRKPENTRPSAKKLEETRTKVEKVLVDGVKRMQEQKKLDATLVGAVLSLAQLYIDTNRPEEALKWLNDPEVGSLTLLEKGNEHTKTDKFATEAYKVALRSYIGVLPKYKNDEERRDETMKNAEAVMDSLEKAVGQDEQAGERLTQIYIIMGKDLEAQLLGVRNDPKAREALSEAFEQFLARIAQRPGNTYASLIWVGETFYNLGSAGDTTLEEKVKATQ